MEELSFLPNYNGSDFLFTQRNTFKVWEATDDNREIISPKIQRSKDLFYSKSKRGIRIILQQEEYGI